MQYCLLCEREIVLPSTWFHVVRCPPLHVCCEECERQFERVSGETCRTCHRPLTNVALQYKREDLCYDCIRWEEDAKWKGTLHMNRSIYTYNDPMRDVLATAKFRGDIALFHLFEQSLQQAYRTYFSDVDMIVPIPLSEERMYERGFNQAEVLASLLPARVEEVMTRVHGEKQSKKSRTERIHVENVFRYNKSNQLAGQTVLLVDDIYTTGSTLRHAAYVLRGQGAGKISSLTLARG